MATVKVTFTLDRKTIERLNQAADRLAIPKSEVVREAIEEYHQRLGRLSEGERQRMLDLLDKHLADIPERPQAEVEKELRTLRKARRAGGRRSKEG
jgi:predicted transcriptional regulator